MGLYSGGLILGFRAKHCWVISQNIGGNKGRTIRKVMGGGGKFFMFAFFFQVVSCVCMFFLSMSSRMQFFFSNTTIQMLTKLFS